MKQDNILIVDDDHSLRQTLRECSQGLSCHVYVAGSCADAWQVIRQNPVSLVVLDVLLPDGSGIGMLKQLRDEFPKIHVIIITGSTDINNAVEALRLGAYDFLTKPFLITDYIAKVSGALGINDVSDNLNRSYQTHNIVEKTCDTKPLQFLIGNSPQIKHVIDLVMKVAAIDTADVLITGESGVGKELVARAVHQFSTRNKRDFFAVNCSSIPEALFESQFFGHTRQAFTGAIAPQKGVFEATNGGTLFLDEISNLPLNLQSKFLRVLETRKINPVGSNKTVDIDIRLLYASNVNLQEMVQEGTFRSDLYHRLNTFEINIPPLRDRREDIRPLIDHFCRYFSQLMKIDLPIPENNVYNYLEQYDYPGNVRELKNIIRKAIILNESASGMLSLISFPALNPTPTSLTAMPVFTRGFQKLAVLEDIEKQWIQYALLEYKHNISKAALELGISRPALHRKIEKYNL